MNLYLEGKLVYADHLSNNEIPAGIIEKIIVRDYSAAESWIKNNILNPRADSGISGPSKQNPRRTCCSLISYNYNTNISSECTFLQIATNRYLLFFFLSKWIQTKSKKKTYIGNYKTIRL